MLEFILGGIVGIAAGTVQQILHQFVFFEVMKLRLVPWRPTRRQAFLNSVRRTLSKTIARHINFLLFAPVVPLIVLAWIFGGPWVALGALVGYPIVPGLTKLALRSAGLKFRAKIQKLAVDRLMRHGRDEDGSSTEMMAMLAEFAQNSPAESKVIALRQIARLGSPEGRPLLEKFQNAPDKRIQTAAEAALENLDRIISGDNLLSAKQLPVFIDEAEYWHRQYYARRGLGRRESETRQAELIEIINDIVDSQMLLKQAYPHLLCTNCHTRAEEHHHGRWTYVLCRHCGDVVDLITDVNKVVGRIGNFPRSAHEDGVYYLNVWNRGKNKAIFADLDELEIQGRCKFNYDWAVSAVVAQLREHIADPDWTIPVTLRKNPPLDANSRKLLDEISRKD